jgi:serine-type D-Ala-D-Ala carboxypeptidase/endopeptidase (penicillin-binding protein 4)
MRRVRNTVMRRALVVLTLLLLACAPSAQAISRSTLRSTLRSAMRSTSPASGAFVRDLTTGRTLFSYKASVERSPASVEKLYTTSTALLRFGPDASLTTTVLGTGSLDALGVYHGDLYLRGGGDPTLSTTGIQALADALAGVGITRVDGAVRGDESRFDLLRGSFASGGAYDPDMGGVLGAMVVNRGFSKDGRPAADAARRLTTALRGVGVGVSRKAAIGLTPSGAVALASLPSPPIRDLIRLTNVPSDNYYAEMLLKDLGATFGGAGTTAAGAAVVRAQVNAFGIRPAIVDGSGLSRVDHTSPRQLVNLFTRIHAQPALAPIFEGSLAVAGRSGTLIRRLRGTAAQDRCHGKTGTLIGVSALAGICQATGGHTIAFALLMNRALILPAHRAQDRIARAVARYTGA